MPNQACIDHLGIPGRASPPRESASILRLEYLAQQAPGEDGDVQTEKTARPGDGTGRWVVLPRALEVGTWVILLLAAGTEITTAAVAGAPAVQYLPVVVLMAGVALSYRIRHLGLALVTAAPLVAVLSERPLTGIWSMACFAAFLFTIRGLSALLGGVVIATANFAAVAWDVGTINVNVDSSASISAFAALVCAATGSAIRGNHRYRTEAEKRVHDAELTRLAAVERGIAQERLRIARDLHDSVGHQIAVVNMRLGAAEVHLPGGATATRADLAAARDSVQAVLRETQQILAVLRIGEVDQSPEPTPGHTAVRELIDSYRQAGMTIEATIDDGVSALSAQASVAVYRIVQESLTNAQKHGDGIVSVTMRQDDHGEVLIEVVNLRGVQSASSPPGGNGLIGMRERAMSVGGDLETRSDDRMFWVTATIPASRETER